MTFGFVLHMRYIFVTHFLRAKYVKNDLRQLSILETRHQVGQIKNLEKSKSLRFRKFDQIFELYGFVAMRFLPILCTNHTHNNHVKLDSFIFLVCSLYTCIQVDWLLSHRSVVTIPLSLATTLT